MRPSTIIKLYFRAERFLKNYKVVSYERSALRKVIGISNYIDFYALALTISHNKKVNSIDYLLSACYNYHERRSYDEIIPVNQSVQEIINRYDVSTKKLLVAYDNNQLIILDLDRYNITSTWYMFMFNNNKCTINNKVNFGPITEQILKNIRVNETNIENLMPILTLMNL